MIRLIAAKNSWMMAFLGAVLLWAALPPLDWWPLAWIAPIPWVLLIRLEKLPGRRPYWVLTLAGFCFWMAALHWLRLPDPATSIGWVALSFYFAFYLPTFVGLARVAVHRFHIPVILAAPVIWTGLELARAHLLTGMSMGNLGHTQFRWIKLIQISDLTGDYGVGFVVMFVAAALARMIPCDGSRRHYWPLIPAAAMLIAVLLYGHFRMDGILLSVGPRIALIQGSIDIDIRHDPGMKDRIFKEYYDLSREAVEKTQHLDLVVWPETMFLGSLATFDPEAAPPADFPGTEAEFRDWLPKYAEQNASDMAQLAQLLGVPLLLGVDANHFGRDGLQRYNSAAHVSREGQLLGRYDKMHLVMFGEYVPLADRLPWLQRLTPLPFSSAAGQKPAVFQVADTRVAPSICYETVLSHFIRRQVNTLAADGQEPDILVNLTNDGWFWGSSELDMHLACAVFRAVECRKPLLIAANTGFSASIDCNGRIVEQGPRRARKVLIAEPLLDHRSSWYLKHGDWFAGLCLIVCVFCGLTGLYGLKSRSSQDTPRQG